MNAATGGTGILFSPQAYNALTSAEMITSRIMIATFNGNPQTTIISCYSPTNISDETEVKKFYQELISVTKQVSNTIYHINCGVIQRFPALGKVVTTHVKRYRIFSTYVDIANQLLTRHSPLAPFGQVDE